MAVSVFPRPNDGPLKAKRPTVTMTVSTTNGSTLTGVIRTTDGNLIPIENLLLPAGVTTVTFPRGGVPVGSKLILMLDETSGQKAVKKYDLK